MVLSFLPSFLGFFPSAFLILVQKEVFLLPWAIEKPVLTTFLGFDSNSLSCLIVS